MNSNKTSLSVAETYAQMQQFAAAPATAVRPNWVPSSITEEHVSLDESMDKMSKPDLWVAHANHKMDSDPEISMDRKNVHHHAKAAAAIEKHVAAKFGDQHAAAMKSHTDLIHGVKTQMNSPESDKEDLRDARKLRKQHGASHDAFNHLGESATAVRPNWVPSSITEEHVSDFVKAVLEARANKQSIVEFSGKKYLIKEEDPEQQKKDLEAAVADKPVEQPLATDSKELQKDDEEEAPVEKKPEEVKEEDSAAIQQDTVTTKGTEEDPKLTMPMMAEDDKEDEKDHAEPDADNMGGESDHDADNAEDEKDHAEPDADNMGGESDHDADNADEDEKKSKEMDEKLVGNQKKLDVNHNGKIDGDDLKKLRGESTEHLDEVLTSKDPAGKWVHDFVHSKNPKFAGKSQEQRKKMALGAYYGSQRESVEYNPGVKQMMSVADAYTQMQKPVEAPTSLTESTMVLNENVAGDPHAANLSDKANKATAWVHAGEGKDKTKDIQNHQAAYVAHRGAAAHYRVYAHHAGDPVLRSAAQIHHKFHDDMANHHSLRSINFDESKKPVKEGTQNDAKGGPEVMDVATKKVKDDAEKNIKIVDGVPVTSVDGAEKLVPADAPAADVKNAAGTPAEPTPSLETPKVSVTGADKLVAATPPATGTPVADFKNPVVQNPTGAEGIVQAQHAKAPTKLKESAMNEAANISSLWNLHSRHADSARGGFMTDDEHARSKKKAIETHVEKKYGAEHKTDMMAHSRLQNSVAYSDMNPSRKSVDTKLSKMTDLRNKHGISHHAFPKDSHDMNHWHSFRGEL